jgi:hypothetical protein
MPRQVPCPVCQAQIIQKTGGRQFAAISRLLEKVRINIDISALTGLLGPKKIKASPDKCKACNGKGSVEDVTDSKEKEQAVAKIAQSNSKDIMEQESKLGLGGSRVTIVAGNDLLKVGLAENTNKTYQVHQGKGVRSRGIGPQTENMPLPQGGTCNVVEGIQTPWPEAMGTYTIKCAHKLHLDSGAGGTTISTKGPLIIQSGKIMLTGPEVTIGCEQGPLTLTGDVVNINGKSIEVGPSDGHLFVKGTISNTGNMITAGHTHSESISFVKASCPATYKETELNQAAQNDSTTTPAVWGGMGVKGIMTSLLEMQTHYSQMLSDLPTAAWRLMAPADILAVVNKMSAISKMCYPIELIPTGLAFGIGVSIVYNFPHHHGVPPMQHKHWYKTPDFDLKSNSGAEIRKKFVTDSLASGAPMHVDSETGLQRILKGVKALQGVYNAINAAYNQVLEKLSWF